MNMGRGLLWAGVAVVFGSGFVARPAQEPIKPWVVIVGGSTDGYLSPCGCTKPMSGGIRPRATATRASGEPDRTLVLDGGNLVAGVGRQDEIKAETVAESLRSIGVDALNLTASDARLGSSMVGSIVRLSGSRVVSASIEGVDGIRRSIVKGPFVVTGISPGSEDIVRRLGGRSLTRDAALAAFLDEAKVLDRTPILLWDGDRIGAEALAKAHPSLALIVYRSGSKVPATPFRVGETWLVTPGEKSKAIVRLEFSGGKWSQYRAVALGPEFEDDAQVGAMFKTYLSRVGEERLLEKLPRAPSAAFAGSKRCGSCHPAAYKVWKESRHADALSTLEKGGQDRDPDCVGCHVVGLELDRGFRSRSETPQLSDVGCESCHGPGAAHSAGPTKAPMPQVGAASCRSCHVPDHSPGFDYESYWKKIAH